MEKCMFRMYFELIITSYLPSDQHMIKKCSCSHKFWQTSQWTFMHYIDHAFSDKREYNLTVSVVSKHWINAQQVLWTLRKIWQWNAFIPNGPLNESGLVLWAVILSFLSCVQSGVCVLSSSWIWSDWPPGTFAVLPRSQYWVIWSSCCSDVYCAVYTVLWLDNAYDTMSRQK